MTKLPKVIIIFFPKICNLLIEFVLHNPTILSQKYWITNGALHSNYSVVFA